MSERGSRSQPCSSSTTLRLGDANVHGVKVVSAVHLCGCVSEGREGRGGEAYLLLQALAVLAEWLPPISILKESVSSYAKDAGTRRWVRRICLLTLLRRSRICSW